LTQVWEAIALRLHASVKQLEDRSPPNLKQQKPQPKDASQGVGVVSQSGTPLQIYS
jgi:hypothetical protein